MESLYAAVTLKIISIDESKLEALRSPGRVSHEQARAVTRARVITPRQTRHAA